MPFKTAYNNAKALGDNAKHIIKEIGNIDNLVNGGVSTGMNGNNFTDRTNNNTLYPAYNNTRLVQDDVAVIDNDWVINRFMAADEELDPIDVRNRYWSNSRWKTFDTSPGNNLAINARPQYTRYADIRNGSRGFANEVTVLSTTGNYGMGRYYSEAIDDNATTIFMEFGVPKFNSLISFFTRAIDGKDLYVAKTGRIPNDFAYTAGWAIGRMTIFLFFPAMASLGVIAKFAAGLFQNTGDSFNYYYMERTMHTYWGSVATIATQFAVEAGILQAMFQKDSTQADKIGGYVKVDKEDLEALHKLFPRIFKNDGYIDVYALATRAQAVACKQRVIEYKQYRASLGKTATDMIGYNKGTNGRTEYNSPGSRLLDTLDFMTAINNNLLELAMYDFKTGYEEFKNNLLDSQFKPFDKNEGDPTLPPKDINKDKTPGEEVKVDKDDNHMIDKKVISDAELNKLKEYGEGLAGLIDESVLDATIRDGGMFAVFNVDYQGSVSESFSNSTGEIAIKDGAKSVARAVHDIRFNTAGGNISDMVTEAVDAVKPIVQGAIEGVSLGLSNVVETLLGAYVDVPLKWEDSQASFPSITYKVRLASPYGNPISQLLNIYIPLSMLLAGTLPMGVGKSSYTSPFLCAIYNKGVQRIDMGMITSLSIDRGVSNLGFTKDKRALAIDVSFTVTDFSSLIATPVNKSMVSSKFAPVLEDDTKMGKYISVLAARSITTQKYFGPKFRMLAGKFRGNFNNAFNLSNWAMRTGEFMNKYTPVGMFVQDGMYNEITQQ